MESINMHDAKTRLSQLVAKVADGESFIIAKSGKPVARLVAIDAPDASLKKRVGFLKGHFQVPDNFDQIGQDEILHMFGG